MNAGSPRSRISLLLKWAIGVPVVVLLIFIIGIGARYVPNKARLDRLRNNQPGSDKVTIEFVPVVPNWIRNLVGNRWCEPLDDIKALTFQDVTGEDLVRWHGCFDVETVSIAGDDQLTDAALSELAGLRNVKNLELTRGNFSTNGLLALARCPQLAKLQLIAVELSPDWCDAIKKCPNLFYLELVKADAAGQDEITPREIEVMASHPHLRKVRLGIRFHGYSDDPFSAPDDSPTACAWFIHTKHLTSEHLAPLIERKDLDTLTLPCESIATDALAPVRRFASLRKLQVCDYENGIRKQQLSSLTGCPKLASLELHDFGVDRSWDGEPDSLPDQGLGYLADLPSLTDLILEGPLGPTDWINLGRLTNLRALRISSSWDAYPQGLQSLKSLVKLEELDLEGWVFEDLDVIKSLPKLRWLRFDTYATVPHPLHELAQRPDFPVALKADLTSVFHQIELQANDLFMAEHPNTVSLGSRSRLPKKWTMPPGMD